MNDAVSDRRTATGLLISTAVLIACVLALTWSCAPASPPEEPPSIRGQITSITPSEKGSEGSVLIEGAKESDTAYDKASVRITADTRIFDADGNPGLSFGDLETGMRVEAWFTGPSRSPIPCRRLPRRSGCSKPASRSSGRRAT